MVFPVVMYGCESWTVKKAERWRIDAFELWCWRKLLRVPWTARGSNQSILRRSVLGIHWKEWCWGWNSNTLATWCEELTHWKRPWCWKDWGQEEKGTTDGWMASPTRWAWVWVNSGSWWRTGRPGVLWFMRLQRGGHDWVTELNWTVPCLVLTIASWPAYRFLRRQVRWSDIPISWRIFHSFLWSTQSNLHKELMLLNCGVGEDSWGSLGLQGDPTSPS